MQTNRRNHASPTPACLYTAARTAGEPKENNIPKPLPAQKSRENIRSIPTEQNHKLRIPDPDYIILKILVHKETEIHLPDISPCPKQIPMFSNKGLQNEDSPKEPAAATTHEILRFQLKGNE